MQTLNIVFDFGAVLFTWQPRVLVREVFPLHASTDAQAIALAHDVFNHADWRAFDGGLISQTEVVQRTHTRTGLDAQALHNLVNGIARNLQPIGTSIALLTELRTRRDAGESIKLYFLSNMPEPYARVLEQRHSFIDWFDDGIFSGDIKLTKPDPAIYALASQQFGAVGASTIFVDDMQANVEASRKHGWRGVHLPDPAALRTKLLDEIGLQTAY
jgi:putative hydrolase of the HAD superfamily